MGKTNIAKPHRVILRSPLSRIHYYHNKRLQVKESQYLIPTYSWTFTPILNWTCSIVTISPCNAWLPVRDFNHQLEKVVGYKVLQFITRWRSRRCLFKKSYSAQTQQLLHKKNELGQKSVSDHNLLKQTLINTCATCVLVDGPKHTITD